LSCGEASSLS